MHSKFQAAFDDLAQLDEMIESNRKRALSDPESGESHNPAKKTLTDEQKARMEENKRKALEKKRAREMEALEKAAEEGSFRFSLNLEPVIFQLDREKKTSCSLISTCNLNFPDFLPFINQLPVYSSCKRHSRQLEISDRQNSQIHERTVEMAWGHV